MKNLLPPKRSIVFLILATTVFYATGRLAYEHIYRLTIDIVKFFTQNKIGFFGKFPFWFFGDPTFGLIFGSIPLTIYLTHKLFLKNFNRKVLRTIYTYALSFLAAYFFFCYLESIQLTASNDFIKDGEIFRYGIRRVNLNQIFLLSIIVATVLTNFTLLISKWIYQNKLKQSRIS